jgi:hypothetical protein
MPAGSIITPRCTHDTLERPMQTLLTSLLGETVELVRDCFDSPAGTRGVIRAVYLSGNPDREEVGGPLLFPYCLVQLESGELISFEAIFLRVVSTPQAKR